MAEERTQRRLAAVLAADVAGYSRLMAVDEPGTLARLKRLRAEVIEPKIAQFQGHIVGSAGDSLLVEFASAINAVQCAVEAQLGMAGEKASLPEGERMVFRMGVNLGDIIAAEDTITSINLITGFLGCGPQANPPRGRGSPLRGPLPGVGGNVITMSSSQTSMR